MAMAELDDESLDGSHAPSTIFLRRAPVVSENVCDCSGCVISI